MHSAQAIEGNTPVVTQVSHRDRLERALRVLLVVAFSAVLIFGPLALGAVQDWSIALLQAASAAVLLIWMAWRLSTSGIAAPLTATIKIRWNPLVAVSSAARRV